MEGELLVLAAVPIGTVEGSARLGHVPAATPLLPPTVMATAWQHPPRRRPALAPHSNGGCLATATSLRPVLSPTVMVAARL